MVTKVIMPKFGLSMETGVLGSWLVEEGDSVTKGSAHRRSAGEARVKGALLRTAQSRRLQHPLSRKRPPQPILKSRRGPKR